MPEDDVDHFPDAYSLQFQGLEPLVDWIEAGNAIDDYQPPQPKVMKAGSGELSD